MRMNDGFGQGGRDFGHQAFILHGDRLAARGVVGYYCSSELSSLLYRNRGYAAPEGCGSKSIPIRKNPGRNCSTTGVAKVPFQRMASASPVRVRWVASPRELYHSRTGVTSWLRPVSRPASQTSALGKMPATLPWSCRLRRLANSLRSIKADSVRLRSLRLAPSDVGSQSWQNVHVRLLASA